MADIAQAWKQAVPTIQNQVSGRGVWAAVNAAVPVAEEDGLFVLGIPTRDSELAGHLRIPATLRLIEITLSRMLGKPTRVQVIEGTTQADYELMKRREAERRKLQDLQLVKMRAELESRTNWDSVYDQLSRRFAALSNRSLPQNRARFFEEAVELVADARKQVTNVDDAQERSFARCLERIAQYCEIPSVVAAIHVMQRVGEL